jgi:Ca-activated chloride channel family protein
LGGESPDTTVRVFTVGYSQGADADTRTQIAAASAGGYYDAKDPAKIDQVMVNVLSNF